MKTELKTEPEVTIVKTTNLENQQQQTEELKNRISQVQQEVFQRQTNFELNLKELRRQRDETIAELREKYDGCLDKGDAVGADKCLAEIRKVREDLVNVAQNIVDVDSDISDLDGRQNELRLVTIGLCQLATANLKKAKELSVRAGQLLGIASDGIGRDLRKLESTSADLKKSAQQILSE